MQTTERFYIPSKIFENFRGSNDVEIEYKLDPLPGVKIEAIDFTELLNTLTECTDYINKILGEDSGNYAQKKFVLRIKNVGRHAHEGGRVMQVNIDQFNRNIHNSDPYYIDLEKSLLCHEVAHSVTDNEDLPMLIEIIFMLEHKYSRRMMDLLDIFYSEESSGQNPRYTEALDKIAKHLNLGNGEEMIRKFETNYEKFIPELKDLFRRLYAEYLK